MSELEVIHATLVRTARRARWQRAWDRLWYALFLGSLLWLAGLFLYKILPLPERFLVVAGGLSLAVLPVGFLLGWWRPPSLRQVARWIDARQQLQERLSTALEVGDDGQMGRWRDLVLSDAATHAQRFDATVALPYHLPRITRWTVLVLVVAVGLGFVSEYRSATYLRQRHEAEVVRETGRQLEALVRRQLDQRVPALESTRQALESVQELAAQLAQVKLTRAEALRELASVSERLRDEARELGRNPVLRRLDHAARSPGGRTASAAGEIRKQIERLQQQLGQAGNQPEALERLQQNLQNLQQTAANLPESSSADAQAAREQLTQALAELSRQATELGLALPNLEDAIRALEGGQIDQMLRDLRFAEVDLEQMAKMARALQDLQQQLADVGKDLAEQLEKGQGLPALATLDRMMKQLKETELSKETLDRLREEISRAVEPGSQYGKVGEFLAAATQQLQRGDRAQTSEALGRAADELRRLMEQMADSEDLLASLEGLQMAQMSVGNGLSWGLCRSPRSGFRPGGRPGRGVGTWADDEQWLDSVENSGLWDNSGVERPDHVPRGTTDRGEGQLSDALTPTKVRGQISPSGAMPSINLRGVSIRGESRVRYEEVVTGAQTEARSALSQERVPRAYRGPVRDYFDDLK
jgi:hypothetical protein